jgi:ATP-dependent helicase/nuclease subunit B
MRLFEPAQGPRILALPPGVDFSRALVAGLEARMAGAPPGAWARVELWVNTRRAQRGLRAIFAEGPARLLPRIRVITELADDALAPVALPAPVPQLRRRLELARLVRALIAAEPGLAPQTAAFDLAESLAELLDELQGEGVELGRLAALDAGDHAAHWQRSLKFLRIIEACVGPEGAGDAQARMRAAAEAWGREWAARPPAHPVIVAGSTGSRGATRAFMAAVARLPQGAVVLPGLDPELGAEVWERLGRGDPQAMDHPQFGFARLAAEMGFDPAAVPAWHGATAACPERGALVSLALRPAPVTDRWRVKGPALAPGLQAAMAGVTWLEAENPRAEAAAVALALRSAAEDGRRAALVTPDRTLARRVTAALARWGIIPDDSAGRPLGLTPPGVLLVRLAELPGVPLTPEALLVLLKHPLVASGKGARREHLARVRDIELGRLRGGAPVVDWDGLATWAAERGAEAWLGWLRAALAGMAEAGVRPLGDWVARHRAAAEALAAGPEGTAAHGLWEKDAGIAALALLEELAAEAGAGGALDAAEYRALVGALMAGRDVPEEAVVTHARVAIWGTLEARVQSADLVILGGLNEGVWPRLPGPDPWLSRAMRAGLGLPSPERLVGLSAHDFQQATGARAVVLARATRDAEAPTVASRWLLRLETLLAGLGPDGKAALAAAKKRGARLAAQAAALERPEAPVAPARRPAPRPPAAARPARLSVTQLETLVRDPYAIYARHVLRLRPLDPPGRQADALARGTAVHGMLETFLAATEGGLPADAEALFVECARRELERAAPWPAVRAAWLARLERAAVWFVDGERERRAFGAPLAREVKGRAELEGTPLPFEVSAQADRIDRGPAGYAIYDYKSGSGPSKKEAAAFHLQLPLEAGIAARGGFEGLPAGPVARMALVKIGGREVLEIERDPVEVWDRLRGMIARYQDPATGFVARLRPQWLSWAGDYDHLARWGEWADGDEAAP